MLVKCQLSSSQPQKSEHQHRHHHPTPINAHHHHHRPLTPHKTPPPPMYSDAALMMLAFSPEPPPQPPPRSYRPPPPDAAALRRCFDAGAPNLGNLMYTSSVSEYDLGGEGDLFKAPEPIVQGSELAVDPMIAAMSIMSSGEDAMTETINIAAMESIEEDSLFSDVFYECEKDLLAKSAIEDPICELADLKYPAFQTEEMPLEEKIFTGEGSIQRSISTGCLSSTDWPNECIMRPNFLDFQGLDFEAAYGIRRAFSEGDMQGLGNNNVHPAKTMSTHSPFERIPTINSVKAEERREKILRYRNKKAKRNFGRKIKYACRKALADSQPRVRGRFAKTEDGEVPKPH